VLLRVVAAASPPTICPSPSFPPLATQQGFDVICYCANVGQYKEDFDKVREKAMKCGASKVRPGGGREGGEAGGRVSFQKSQADDDVAHGGSHAFLSPFITRCISRTSARSS